MTPPRSRRGRPQHGRRGRRGPTRQPQGTSLVGQRFVVDVEDVAHGGHCVARHDGRVVFVRHTLPGEQVVVEVTSGTDRTSFLRADAVEVLRAAPQRREAPCPVAGPGGCGGCDWQHTDAAFGRELKARVVREQLRRLAGLDLPVTVEQVPGDEEGLRWRTRLELAVDDAGRAGLHPHRSHEVIPVEDCLIATPAVVGSGAVGSEGNRGVRALDVAATSTGEVVVTPRPSRDPAPVVHEQVALRGHTLDFALDATGFWQVHPGAARTLVTAVLDGLRPRQGELVTDLYAGVGLFAAELARRVGPTGQVIAVEGDRRAAEHAGDNLAGVPWAEAVHADVTRWVTEEPEPLAQSDLVVLDPPRTGAGKDVLTALLAGRPRAVAYVACDPAALARDLATAKTLGYQVDSLQAYDLFPMTHHVECVAVLTPTEGPPELEPLDPY